MYSPAQHVYHVSPGDEPAAGSAPVERPAHVELAGAVGAGRSALVDQMESVLSPQASSRLAPTLVGSSSGGPKKKSNGRWTPSLADSSPWPRELETAKATRTAANWLIKLARAAISEGDMQADRHIIEQLSPGSPIVFGDIPNVGTRGFQVPDFIALPTYLHNEGDAKHGHFDYKHLVIFRWRNLWMDVPETQKRDMSSPIHCYVAETGFNVAQTWIKGKAVELVFTGGLNTVWVRCDSSGKMTFDIRAASDRVQSALPASKVGMKLAIASRHQERAAASSSGGPCASAYEQQEQHLPEQEKEKTEQQDDNAVREDSWRGWGPGGEDEWQDWQYEWRGAGDWRCGWK